MSLQSLHSIVQPGERGLLESIFVGYVQLTAESPYPIIVYSVANYRPHLRDTSQVTVSLLPRIFPFLRICYPNNPEKGRRGGGGNIFDYWKWNHIIVNPSLENATPSSSTFPVAYYEEVYLSVVPVEVTCYMDGLSVRTQKAKDTVCTPRVDTCHYSFVLLWILLVG